jgi:leader peptidase (prepilin peptidase) / N-methyltransferase
MLTRWSSLISQTRVTTRTLDELTIILAGVASIAASLIVLPNALGVVGAGLAILMIAIAVIDARRFIIPNELTAAALALGFLSGAMQGSDLILELLASAALRGAVMAIALLVLRILYRRVRSYDGIGLGDVKLAGVAGVWLDWWALPVAIEIAALAAITVYALRFLYGRRPSAGLKAKLPFGLFLAPAIWVGWMLEALFEIPSAGLLQLQ